MENITSLEEYKNVPLNYLLATDSLVKNNPLGAHRYIANIVKFTGEDPATVQWNVNKLSKDMYVHKYMANYNMNQTKANAVDIIRDFKNYIKEKHKI